MTAVTFLCFGPGAFAQSAVGTPVSAPALTRSVGAFVLNPIVNDLKADKKKKVAAAEGGSPALYLLLAGFACCGAMFLRSRQPLAEKSF